MKSTFKILHSADLHFDTNDLEQCQKSFNQIIDYTTFNNISLNVVAGDVFDKAVVLEEAPNSPINPAIDSFVQLAEITPVYVVEGNPPHDKFGSLEILTKLDTKFPIKVVSRCEDTFTVFNNGKFIDYPIDVSLKVILSKYKESETLLIFGLPWPIKPRFLTNKELQKPLREVADLYKVRLDEWIAARKKLFKSLKNRYGFLFVGHLQLNGAIASSGQELTSIYHSPAMYQGMSHYGALGHIHLAQRDKELHYSGSIRNKNWGELERKQFNVVEYKINTDGVKVNVRHEVIKTPLMLKVKIAGEEELKNINSILKKNIDPKIGSYKVWLSISGIKNKNSVDKNKIEGMLKKLNSTLEKLDVTEVIITSQRTRDTTIHNQTLKDKYIDWCAINDLTYTKFQINKLQEAELLI